MDAIKFLEERKRMFKKSGLMPSLDDDDIDYNFEEAVKMVEEWSAAHPRKTRQSLLLEQYPNAKCVDGISVLCPIWIDTCFSCPIDGNNNVDCATCRHEFWMQEVE